MTTLAALVCYLPRGKLDTQCRHARAGPDRWPRGGHGRQQRRRDQTGVQANMFNANGTVDSAVDDPPFTYTGRRSRHESPSAVAVQPTGQIVIAS